MSENDVSPLNISEIKLRLRHESLSFYAATDPADEIAALGHGARELMPVVAESLVARRFPVATDKLVYLYEATRSRELLDAMRQTGSIALCALSDQARLFAAGASELEPRLIDELWRRW